MLDNPKITVSAGSLIFPGMQRHFQADPGATILDLVRQAHIPDRFHVYLRVWLDDELIPSAWWHRIRPKGGRFVAIGMAPAGDLTGANGKDTLQLAIPALLQAGIFAGGLALGIPGAIAGAAALLIGGAGGQWIANNLIHVPEPKTNPEFTTISGARNQMRPYECVPRIYGRMRYAPPLAAMTQTTLEGQDQYLRILLTPGYGPMKISDIRIGDAHINAAHRGILTLEKQSLWADNQPITLFSRDFSQTEPQDFPINYADSWYQLARQTIRATAHPFVVTVYTQPETVEIGLDFLFPEGLYEENNKETQNYYVDLMIRYRLRGATGADSWMTYVPPENNPLIIGDLISANFIAWLTKLNAELGDIETTLSAIGGTIDAVSGLLTFSTTQLSGVDTVLAASIASGQLTAGEQTQATAARGHIATINGLLANVDNVVESLEDGVSEFNDTLSRIIFVLSFVNDISFLINAVRNNEGPDIETLPPWQRALIYLFGLENIFQAPPEGSFRVRTNGDSRAPLWNSISWPTPQPGEYEVQIRRVSADTYGQDAIHSLVHLYSCRSITSDDVVSDTMKQKLALVAMKIKATNEFNNQVDQITMLCESPLYWHNGTSWQGPDLEDTAGYSVSRNPAWQFCDILRGGMNATPAVDADLDLDMIREFADWCNVNGYTCDYVFDRRISQEDALNLVCRCGKATASKTGEGKYTVIIDRPQMIPRALITPRNSSDFTCFKNMEERPHALRVKFKNADKDFQDDEAYVYADGYGAEHGLAVPTIIEDIELPGVTSPTKIKHMGRYFLACSELRPETYEVTMDFEHFVFIRGDMVRYQHDVTLIGKGSARITGLEVDGVRTFITCDEHPSVWQWTGGALNGIRIRTSLNTLIYAEVDYDPEIDADRMFITEAYPSGWGDVAVGDLLAIGTLLNETVECIVKAIRPESDLRGRITLIEHAPEVHDADDDIPEYESHITLPYHPELARPPRPEVLSINVGDSATVRLADGTRACRIALGLRLPPGITAAERAAAQNVAGVEVQYQSVSGVSVLPGADMPTLMIANAPWQVMPTFTRDLCNVFVEPVEVGKQYNVRVRSVTRTGVPSEWFLILALTIVGKEGLPPDVTGLKYKDGMLTWNNTIPADFAGFKLRYYIGVGASWESATDLYDGYIRVSNCDVSETASPRFTLFVKAVDTSGNESLRAASVAVSGNVDARSLCATGTLCAASPYPWDTPLNEENMTFSGYSADSDNNISIDPADDCMKANAGTRTNFYSIESGAPIYAYTNIYSNTYLDGYVWFTFTPLYGSVPIEVYAYLKEFDATGGNWQIELQDQSVDLWPADINDNLWPDDLDADLWPRHVRFEPWRGKHKVTPENPQYPLNVKVKCRPDDVQLVMNSITVQFDAEMITETGNDFTVSAVGSVYLPYTKRFYRFDKVDVALSDNNLGYYVKVVDRNPGGGNGPEVAVFDSGDVRAEVDIDWTVIGPKA